MGKRQRAWRGCFTAHHTHSLHTPTASCWIHTRLLHNLEPSQVSPGGPKPPSRHRASEWSAGLILQSGGVVGSVCFFFFFCLLYYSQALKIHEGTCIQISLILILFYTCNNTVWHRQVNHGAPVAWMGPDMQMWKSAPTITQTQECFAPRGRPAAMPWWLNVSRVARLRAIQVMLRGRSLTLVLYTFQPRVRGPQ